MDKKVGNIYRTDKLDMFKVLYSNRVVTNARKRTLITSIEKNGYIQNPIIVNEKFEVIDGQGRLAACKELGLPIDYIIVNGIGVKECMVLNANMKNWTGSDFIKSYAEQGDPDYQRIYELSKMETAIRVFMWINGLYGGTALTQKIIRSGNAVCTEHSFKKTVETLNFIKNLEPCIKSVGGEISKLKKAIAFAYWYSAVDNTRLAEVIQKYYGRLVPVANLRHGIAELEEIYNYRNRGDRVYLSTEYDRLARTALGVTEKTSRAKKSGYLEKE